jgi:hypothetical protein
MDQREGKTNAQNMTRSNLVRPRRRRLGWISAADDGIARLAGFFISPGFRTGL